MWFLARAMVFSGVFPMGRLRRNNWKGPAMSPGLSCFGARRGRARGAFVSGTGLEHLVSALIQLAGHVSHLHHTTFVTPAQAGVQLRRAQERVPRLRGDNAADLGFAAETSGSPS